LVVIDISLMNTCPDTITLALVYLADRPIRFNNKYKPSSIIENRYEWVVAFKAGEESHIQLEVIRSKLTDS
jgi:hypothetical protein